MNPDIASNTPEGEPATTGPPLEVPDAGPVGVPGVGVSSSVGTDRRWRRLGKRLAALGFAFALLVIVLVVAHRPLLTGFAFLFRVDDPAPSDAIVLLIGGFNHRPARAVELYRKGIAPVVLLGKSGDDSDMEFDESKAIRNFLIRKGIPAQAVQFLPGEVVTSTHDEALRFRDYARAHACRKVTLVTTAFHTARARWIFRKVLRGEGIEVHAAAARRREYDESNWYRHEIGLIDYFEETIKTVRYRLAY